MAPLNSVWVTCTVATLLVALAWGRNPTSDQTPSHGDLFPTPDRSQVQVIDDEAPAGLTDADAISAYRQGYAHMRAAAWFSAIAAYDEASASNQPSPAPTRPVAQRICTPAVTTRH